MIKILNGIHETVSFSNNSLILMYNNDESEDYPVHWHSAFEIILPFEGPYTAVCGHKTLNLIEGDILIIGPGTLHNFYAPPLGRRMIFQFDSSLMSNLKDLESVISLISPYMSITPDSTPDIYEKIHELVLIIFNEYLGNSTLQEAEIYSYLIQIFVLIGRQYQFTEKNAGLETHNTKHQEYTKKFLDVCDYINKHYSENLCLEEISTLAGFSKYHFTRLFKQFTGISFYKYLNKKRIMRAGELLVDPEISITEVALRSGFSSFSAFIRMFKIYKNCTPTEFRRMHHLNIPQEE